MGSVQDHRQRYPAFRAERPTHQASLPDLHHTASHEGADPFGQPRLESGKEGSSHVCRGGSWNAGGRSLRAACRVSWSFDDADDNNGFRLARGPE